MSRPFWSVRYLPSLAALPEKLERGRAYFIGDEQYLIVDYGNGPIVYGAKPGPQGIPGEPLPQLQGQIDDLADASVDLTYHVGEIFSKLIAQKKRITEPNETFTEETEATREMLANQNEDIQKIIAGQREDMLELITQNSEALIDLINLMQARFEKLNNVIFIVTKLLASLYPNADIDMNPQSESAIPLTGGEIIRANDLTYRIDSAHENSDGSVSVILSVIDDALQAQVLTMQDGDVFADSQGYIWTVENNELVNNEGVIYLSCTGMQRVIETLKPGDIVEYNGKMYIVSRAGTENGQGVISLVLSE